jgi:hypothetical protein
MNIFNVFITSARFEECQLEGVGGVDYTKSVPSIQNMWKND